MEVRKNWWIGKEKRVKRGANNSDEWRWVCLLHLNQVRREGETLHGIGLWKMKWVQERAAAAKSLQSCLTLCDPIDGSPPGSPIPGILQARTLEWVAIAFSNAWKWKLKVNSLSLSDSSWPHGLQPTRLLHPWDFPGKSTGVGCHCLLRKKELDFT